MTTSTEHDLRVALRKEAEQPTMSGDDLWRTVSRRIKRRRSRTGVMLVVVLVAAVVVVGATTRPTNRVPPRPLLLAPASYAQACAVEPGVCPTDVAGAIPASLRRPLRLPRMSAGGACPVTPGVNGTNPYVFGQQYGSGPIYLELGDRGDPGAGTSVLGSPGRGWLAVENAFLVDPSYVGPFLVDGARLDGPGEVGFGGTPASGAFVEPPGPDPNTHDGYRTPPGTIWVSQPGCYGFQINSLSTTEIVVIDLLPPAAASR